MCKLYTQDNMDVMENTENIEEQPDEGSEDTNYYIDCYNSELREIGTSKFLEPIHLIEYLFNKLDIKDMDSMEMLMDLSNLQHKTNMLFIILFFKENLNLTESVDCVMREFIKDVFKEEVEKGVLAWDFYVRYKADVLTDLLD